MTSLATPVRLGQFDDAQEERTRDSIGQVFIDTYSFDDDDNLDDDDDEDSEDEIDELYDENRVEDEDWEMAERDFTKQFNRLRQHVAVKTGNAQGVAFTTTAGTAVAPLPVINQPRTATLDRKSVVKGTSKDKTMDQLAAFSSKYNSRLAKIDLPYVLGVGVNRKGPSAHANMKDKSDRATNEQVLDPRTRLILFKMIGRGLIHEVNGCVSTGKEANVYHALTPEGKHLALKIYKTSILVFKDRDKYVTGEYRFRRGYSRRNPRKMVRMWAEKEMRNLKRLVAAGIRCPEPVEVRENVLVMTFLGDAEGWASPRLKDASLPPDTLNSLYVELVLIVRRLFHRCKLVHADLSEYNILYHQDHLYIIDVSQSVEHDHPSAFDFLRNDIKNVEEFFGRLGVRCLGLRRCFEFITKENFDLNLVLPPSTEEIDRLEERMLSQWLERKEEQWGLSESGDPSESKSLMEEQAVHEDSVFLQSFIPRSLNEVYDPERDVEKLAKGRGDELIYADTIGIVKPLSRRTVKEQEDDLTDRAEVHGMEDKGTEIDKRRSKPVSLAKVRFEDPLNEEEKSAEQTLAGEGGDDDVDDDEVSDEDEEEDCSDNEQERSGWVERKPRGHRHEDREAKKERKKAVKAEAKERRKNKMPKAEKKKLMKKSKA